MPTFTRGQWSVWGSSYNTALWTAANPPVDPYRTMLLGFPGATVCTAGKTIRDNMSSSNSGPKAIFAFAGGGAFDTDRQKWIGTGSSGHVSVGTNEVNEFDVATGTWTRVMNPTVELMAPSGVAWPAAIAYGGIHLSGPLGYTDVNDHYAAHGTIPTGGGLHAVFPNPVQQYGCVCYIPAPYHKLFMCFGVSMWDPAFGGGIIYEWDTATSKWQGQTAESVPLGIGSAFPSGAVWDSTYSRVLFGNGSNILAYYPGNAMGNRVFTVASYGGQATTNDETCAVWNPKQKRLLFFGGSNSGLQRYYDFPTETPNPSGVAFTVPGVFFPQGAGVIYDPVADRYIYFPGGTNITPNGSLVSIDPVSFAATTISPAAGNVTIPSTPNMGGAGSPGEGMWGRFFYASSIDAYVALPQADDASLFVFPPVRTTTAPILLCTDLIQGNRTGNPDTAFGQTANVDGVYVTAYGFNLGGATDTVALTVGGVACTILDRGDCVAPRSPATLKNTYMAGQMLVFQLNHACPLGSQAIHLTVNGTDSATASDLTFTVANTGTTRIIGSNVQATFDAMAPGDVTYVTTGVTLAGGLALQSNTVSNTQPIALVAYPGATVTIGSTTGTIQGVFISSSGGGGNVTIAKMNLRGAGFNGLAIALREGARIVGNNIQAPTMFNKVGAIHLFGSNLLVGANELTNCGALPYDDQCHVIYRFGRRPGASPETNFRGTMNYFHGNAAVRAFNCFNDNQQGDAPIQDHEIDHNVIVDQIWCGLGILGGVVGTNLYHDNLLVRCGLDTGHVDSSPPAVGMECHPGYPVDWGGTRSAITVKIYGNTFVDCGDAGAGGNAKGLYQIRSSSGYTIYIQNNIHYQSNGMPYVSGDSDLTTPNAALRSNNDWIGATGIPSFETSGLAVDPQFVSAAGGNYHLQSTSPMIGVGAALGLTDTDLDGLVRPATGAWDLGAHQLSTTPSVAGPSLTALVPQSCAPGSPTFTLAVFATVTPGFLTGAQVYWDGSPRTTTVLTTQEVTITVPAADVATVGQHNVTATNPGSALSNTLIFNVTLGPATIDLAWLGTLRDRVSMSEALVPDGFLDGCFQATLHGTGGRTVTALRLDMVNASTTNIGTWDTSTATGFIVLGAATGLDAALLNNPVDNSVNFAVADGGTWVMFASDFPLPPNGIEFVAGNTATLVVTFSDASTAQASVAITSGTPTLTALVPTTITCGHPAFTLVLQGTNFASGCTVLWNGNARATTFVSSTVIQATVLATDLLPPPSTALVSVRNPNLQVSGTLPFTTTFAQQTGTFVSSVH